MKYYFLQFSVGLIILFTACQKQVIEEPTKYIKDGVIVWQKPLWSVPHDTAYYVMSFFKPYFQFDNKVIVETYKDGKGGIRCMEVETGRIVWEKYLGQQVEHHSLSLNINNPYLNEESRYLIFSFGPWGDRKHTRINIDTGATEWEIPLETSASMEGMGDHYYCTVSTDEKVNPIYKVNVCTGEAEHFYSTTLEPHPVSPWGKPGAVARPFLYNNKEYLILAEVRLIGEPTFVPEHFFSLMDAETKELLVEHKPIESPVSKVEMVNGELYLFTGNGYKIFSIETLSVTRDVKLFNSNVETSSYQYHRFYMDKLIVGLSAGHMVVNKNTHTKLFQIDNANVYPSAILDDVIYVLPGGQHFWAYNLNTGIQVLNFELEYKVTACTATYKNAEGKKFVIVSDIGFTYCYEAI
jgi:outer membrane protein assembly factor BamB